MSTIYSKLAEVEELINRDEYACTEIKDFCQLGYFDNGWRVNTKTLKNAGIDLKCINLYIKALLIDKKRELEKHLAKTLCDRIE